MNPQFTVTQIVLLSRCIEAFHHDCTNWLEAVLNGSEIGIPTSLNEFQHRRAAIHKQLNSRFNNSALMEDVCQVSADLLPYLKRCVLYYRRKHVAAMQTKLAHAVDLSLIASYEQSIKAVDACIGDHWFIETDPIRMPRLTDFVTLRYAEQLIERYGVGPGQQATKSPAKEYDDKFGILSPASRLHPVLKYWREQCDLREVGLALAYFDIDNFKRDFNSFTETVVDRNCLPVILRAVEAHCFYHAEAFHVGGDEIIVLLPNVDKQHAVDFMDRLRLHLPTLTYVGVPSKAHISVGVCHVPPDCWLTDAEIEQKANDAKSYAKKEGGKNCVVTYQGKWYYQNELEVASQIATM